MNYDCIKKKRKIIFIEAVKLYILCKERLVIIQSVRQASQGFFFLYLSFMGQLFLYHLKVCKALLYLLQFKWFFFPEVFRVIVNLHCFDRVIISISSK